jgi:hypothetical protein
MIAPKRNLFSSELISLERNDREIAPSLTAAGT